VLTPGMKASREEIRKQLEDAVKREGSQYEIVINFDQSFI
jgi:hypothetical protein